jgi:hypothetical protein
MEKDTLVLPSLSPVGGKPIWAMATIPTLKVHIRESSCRIRLWPLWVSTKSPGTDLGQVLEIVEAGFAVPGVHKNESEFARRLPTRKLG